MLASHVMVIPRAAEYMPLQGIARGQAMPFSTLPFATSQGAPMNLPERMDEARDRKLIDHSKPKNMIHSQSRESLSTTASLRGSSSGCSTEDSFASNPMSELVSVDYSQMPATNPRIMELQRTLAAQEKARKWVSTAMSDKIASLEKELANRAKADEKAKKQKETLDRQRSEAQLMRLQSMEERHQKQHDVYEEAQRIQAEKQQKALEKVQRWDEQVQTVLCDREHNHQMRKNIQQVADRALESLNEKIYQQRVQSKINTAELRDHVTKCLSHKLFDPMAVAHIEKNRAQVSSPRVLRSCSSAQALHASRCENASPTARKARAKSPQYRYRPIETLVPSPSSRKQRSS